MPQKTVKLDGRVGEGGGQVVRIAVALAALTGIPLQIDHVRGNRYVISALLYQVDAKSVRLPNIRFRYVSQFVRQYLITKMTMLTY